MIVDLNSALDPRVPAVLDLAHRLFPPATLEPDEQLLAEMDGRSRLPCRYRVWDEGGVAGFIRFVRLGSGATMVFHIGVEPAQRRKGIGAALLQSVGAGTLMAEVEMGAPMKWWLQAGARPLTTTYTQPALRPETEPCAFTLMAIGELEDVPRSIEEIYREVWKLKPDHQMVRKALAGVVG